MRLMQISAVVAVISLSAFCVLSAGAAEILFIGGQADATQGDDGLVFEHLEDLGHDITYIQASQSSTADGRDVDLIVLSSTPGSGDMRGKFNDLPTPILNWEEALMRWDHADADGQIRTAEFSNSGGATLTDLVNIVNPDHCLAAGLPAGEIVIADDFISMPNSFGELAEGTIVIAEMDPAVATQDPPEAVLTAIETGGILGPDAIGDELPSPGPRVNYFVVDTGFSALNEDGLALFDAAVEWLLNGGACEGGGGDPALEAGDANMDYEFNQLDLVQVQIAAKYLTGAAANWGEGDWDGAPGGTAGSPPPGNGFFDQLDIIAALTGGKYLTGPYAPALSPDPGTPGDPQTSLVYNAGTGELMVDTPASTNLTSINVDSAGSMFTVGNVNMDVLGGSFDNVSDDNLFKATFGSSFGDMSFGVGVLPAGLDKEAVIADLTTVGSLDGGGDLGAVDLVYIPEPSALVLLALGLVGLIASRRRR